MKYTHVTGTELKVSTLCFGTGQFGAKLSETESYKQMDVFFEKGGNFFDTARVYSDWIAGEKGRCERIIGEYLAKRKTRDNWLIGTKGGCYFLLGEVIARISREDLARDIENSLKALKTDYIDLYYLHRDSTKISVEEIIGWMNEFVAMGKIRYFGCSNWKTERIRQAQNYAKTSGQMGFCVNQPLWNLGCYTMTPWDDPEVVVMDRGMIQFHRETGLVAAPYASQAGGFFSKLNSYDESIKQTALQSCYANTTNLNVFSELKVLAEKYQVPISHIVLGYLLSQRITVIPIFSSSSVEQLNDTICADEIKLSADEIQLLDSINGSGLA